MIIDNRTGPFYYLVMVNNALQVEQLETARARYARVNAETDAVIKRFTEAQRAYRAREIGDAEYLAARHAYDAAIMEFDVAYATLADLEAKAAR